MLPHMPLNSLHYTRMRGPSERTLTNVAALLVLLAFVASLIAVPHRWLRPISVAVLGSSVLCVIGMRAYSRRLQSVADFLASHATTPPEELLVALLHPAERRFLLAIPEPVSLHQVVSLLRRRQSMFFHLGMAIALPGICAFLLAIYFFA